MEGVVLGLFTLDYTWGGKNDGGIVRNIAGDNAVCADADVVADADSTDDLGTCADVYVISDYGRTGIFGILQRI